MVLNVFDLGNTIEIADRHVVCVVLIDLNNYRPLCIYFFV